MTAWWGALSSNHIASVIVVMLVVNVSKQDKSEERAVIGNIITNPCCHFNITCAA